MFPLSLFAVGFGFDFSWRLDPDPVFSRMGDQGQLHTDPQPYRNDRESPTAVTVLSTPADSVLYLQYKFIRGPRA